MVQNDKWFCLSRSISLEPYIIWLSFMLHMCKMIMSPGGCFIFSKFWFFWFLGGGGKRAKNCLKWPKISQESYIIWLSFMVHLCKMIISPGFFFKILIFWVVRGVKRQKTVQNDKKFVLLHSISEEPYIKWLEFMVQMRKMITSPGVFFNFKILIFLVVRGLKG